MLRWIATVASTVRIGGPQGAPDFDDDTGEGRSVCGIDWTNAISVGCVAAIRSTDPSGAAGGTVDQNWAKTLPGEAGWSTCGVEIER
jgi:hypothetical protein